MTAEASPAPASSIVVRGMAARVLNADLDLQPFYDLAAGHAVMGPVTRALHGLKGFRPTSPFDMLVIAVIEQQISLAAAHHIRARLVARFGAEVEGEPVFPTPDALAAASLDELTACGLSGRKAEYVSDLAQKVARGEFDLDALETAPSDEVRERIVALRGFGPWSADYFLIRGLARPDALPADDLGIRTIVGKMLGDGGRPSAAEVGTLLAPLAPYRGLAAFYLLVAQRLL
jgi:DNA-3-methyladenine glycosylase II